VKQRNSEEDGPEELKAKMRVVDGRLHHREGIYTLDPRWAIGARKVSLSIMTVSEC
jgi:hypothetical protein